MRLSHFFSLLALSAAACLGQELSVINLTAPDNFILAGRGMKLTASPTSNFGTPISGVVLQWVTSNVNVATVNGQGEVRGTGIGVAEIVARDPSTGVSGKLSLRVLPLAIDMDPQELDLRIGSTTKLTARASDADAKPIVGTKFKYSSGLPSVVTVASDGTLTPVSEGVATVYAEPDGASGFGFVASSLVRVLRRADYTVKKVLDSGTPRPATILGMTNISGSGDVFGGIAALSNGSQAVVVFEQGKPRVVAATGQQLSSTGRVIVRINGLSVNANGDAAVYAEFPDQFCGFTLLLFPKNQEEAEIADGCSIQLLARGLADDGTLVYRLNDSRGTNVMRRKPNGETRTLLTVAGQPTTPDGIRSINNVYPSRGQAMMVDVTLNSGVRTYFLIDGDSPPKRVLAINETISGRVVTALDELVAGADGIFHSRASLSGGTVGLLTIANGTASIVGAGGAIGAVTPTWFHTVQDARDGKALIVADLTVDGQGATRLALWDRGKIRPIAAIPAYTGSTTGALLAFDIAVARTIFASDTNEKIRAFAAVGDTFETSIVAETGTTLGVDVSPSVDWKYLARGAGSELVSRGAADVILAAGGSTVASIGMKLPNGEAVLTIGGTASNRMGDVIFTASYRNGGSGVFLHKGGKLSTLIDTIGATKTPGARALGSVYTHRGRYLSINNRGDVAYFASSNVSQLLFQAASETQPKMIAQVGVAAPGGGNYSDFPTVAVDDLGRVSFISPLSTGSRAMFFWDGTDVKRVFGLGDRGPGTLTANELSNLHAAGKMHYLMLAFGNYNVREMRSFDGATLNTVLSTDSTLLGAANLNSFWINELSASGNGDLHYLAYTGDGNLGVYAQRGGKDLIVARSSERLPGGEWLIMPLSISSGEQGEIYFTAYVSKDGKESLAVYQGLPR